MSKNKNQTTNNANVPTASAAPEPEAPAVELTSDAPEVSAAPTETAAQVESPAPQAEASTELAVLPAEEDNFVALARVLPKTFGAQLRRLKRVSVDDLESIADELPEPKRTNFIAMLDRMNPVKPGMFTREQKFRVPGAIVFHGTGNNDARPELLPAGGIFGSDGRMICVPSSHAAMLKVPDKMTFFALLVNDTNTWWPPRDDDDDAAATLPPDIDPKSKQPICRSLDQKVGFRYGSCKACPNEPWKGGKKPEKNACANETAVYFVLSDFSGVYVMNFAKTAITPGARPISKKTNSWTRPWEQMFQITTRAETHPKDPKIRWYVPVSSVFTDGTNPQGVNPSPAEDKVLAALCDMLVGGVHLPSVADIYRRAFSKTAEAPALPSQAAEMKGLLAAAGGAQAPAASGAVADYSKDNV